MKTPENVQGTEDQNTQVTLILQKLAQSMSMPKRFANALFSFMPLYASGWLSA